ncbi:GP182 protein, partial [Polyodon spathula]|nr:G-protein coupled receptor 182-like [Polyodon spathula]XP_041097675.1 G-protein coupled receptor 182-like [Polyodon spathula]XP_041097676.1 G-protein coupled receptor 182-like [Polyodon spathula]MBN3286296.1 GP182 protein [Polyodon spathula]
MDAPDPHNHSLPVNESEADYFEFFSPSCEVTLSHNSKKIALFVLYLVMFVAGLLQNLLVIWVNWHSRRAKDSSFNLYIFNLALADLGVVLVIPFWLVDVLLEYTWLWGFFFCKFTHFFYFVNMYASIFFLTAFTADCYLSATSKWPFWHRRQELIRRVVCGSGWALALVLPIAETVHVKLTNSDEPTCMFLAPWESYEAWTLAMTLLNFIFGFVIPFPVMLVFNLLTSRQLRSAGTADSRRQCLLIYTYILVFALSWLPFHLVLILLTMHGTHFMLDCYFLHVLYFFYDIIECLSMLHCVLNPILYNFLSKSFRNRFFSAVVHYLPKNRIGTNNQELSSSTQHSVVIENKEVQ